MVFIKVFYSGRFFIYKRGSSAVECRTWKQVSQGSNFCYRFEVWHFRSLHWRPSWLSCINEYLAIDSGGHVSDLAVAHNCCMPSMLPGEAVSVSEWTGLPGKAKSVLSRPTDWILRYIKTTSTFIRLLSQVLYAPGISKMGETRSKSTKVTKMTEARGNTSICDTAIACHGQSSP